MRNPSLPVRTLFAAMAVTLLASASAPPVVQTSDARVTVRIERPVSVRAGDVREETGKASRPARERRCVEGDVPAGSQCRLLVTDIE